MDIRNWYQDTVKEVFADIYVSHHILIRSQLQWIEENEIKKLTDILNNLMKSNSTSILEQEMLGENYNYWYEVLDIRFHGFRLVEGLIPVLYVIINSQDLILKIPNKETYREIVKSTKYKKTRN